MLWTTCGIRYTYSWYTPMRIIFRLLFTSRNYNKIPYILRRSYRNSLTLCIMLIFFSGGFRIIWFYITETGKFINIINFVKRCSLSTFVCMKERNFRPQPHSTFVVANSRQTKHYVWKFQSLSHSDN